MERFLQMNGIWNNRTNEISNNLKQRVSRNMRWFRGIFWEVRTRILLWYAFLLIAFVAVSVVLFREILFTRVDTRGQNHLNQQMASFLNAYQQWQNSPNSSSENIGTFISDFLARELPVDDNSLLFLLDGSLFGSSPRSLPDSLGANSQLIKHLAQLKDSEQREQQVFEANIGSIIYLAEPISFEGKLRGVFVVAYTTAKERQEVLEELYIFLQVKGVGLVIALVIGWFISGRLLASLRNLSAAARSISKSDLNKRISVQGQGEIAELAMTFNSMMNRLQSAFNSQRNFINDAGHELRTPITIIRGHLELMGNDPQEQKETIALVIDELDRMSRFVDDLLFLAKTKQPDFLRREIVDLGSLMEELYTKVKVLAERDWQLESKASGKIIADRQRLTQAILNLAQNATQHTQPNDRIAIGSSSAPKEVRFWVKDTGSGIPRSERERIFERFARGANIRRSSLGAGLGLPIVDAIAKAHDGRVELSSEVGVGSTFTIVIPIEMGREGKFHEENSYC